MAVALARDDSAQAKIAVERLLAAAEPLRNRRARAVGHLGLARALLLEGDDQRAESVTHDALKVLMDHGWRPGVDRRPRRPRRDRRVHRSSMSTPSG